MTREILTADQASELLGVSKQTVRRWADAGVIPGRKVGKVWLFSLRQLVEFVEAGQEPVEASR